MSSKKKPVRQLVEGIGLVATPFDFPVDVCRVLHNQADIMAVGAEAPGDSAFDSTVEPQWLDLDAEWRATGVASKMAL